VSLSGWHSSEAIQERLKATQVWWCTPVIPALGRQKQEDFQFEASLGYIASPRLKLKKKKGRLEIIHLGGYQWRFDSEGEV
jgi:hypothetical protein